MEQMNPSGLTPLGRAVLVRMVEIEELQATSIVIPDSVRSSTAVMEQKAEVIAVGSECWADEGIARAKPGDRVIITKFAGYVAMGPKDKKIYRLVNDRDIFCRIEEN
jgi:co-chaperonin GroES (HSP10)